jgi:hypothetical protein
LAGIAGRLDDEHVLAADILVDLDENLLVGEAPDAALGQLDFEIVGIDWASGRLLFPASNFICCSPALTGFSERPHCP